MRGRLWPKAAVAGRSAGWDANEKSAAACDPAQIALAGLLAQKLRKTSTRDVERVVDPRLVLVDVGLKASVLFEIFKIGFRPRGRARGGTRDNIDQRLFDILRHTLGVAADV